MAIRNVLIIKHGNFEVIFKFPIHVTEVSPTYAPEPTENVYWKGVKHTYLLDEGNNWGGDTAHTFSIMRTIGMGTLHNIKRISLGLECGLTKD